MKKILIIHTKYRNLGGEDTAVVNENILLNENYEVNILYFNNKIKNLPKQFFSFLLNQNKESMNILQEKINNFNPDIAYVHNTWFKASLGIFKILKKNNIRVLLKLHNFRYDCTRYFFASSHLRGLKICPACGMNQKRGRIVNKYFEDSYLKSFLIIYYGKKYFNIIIKSDIQILVLTQYHKDYLVNLGLEESRINIFPNYQLKIKVL